MTEAASALSRLQGELNEAVVLKDRTNQMLDGAVNLAKRYKERAEAAEASRDKWRAISLETNQVAEAMEERAEAAEAALAQAERDAKRWARTLQHVHTDTLNRYFMLGALRPEGTIAGKSFTKFIDDSLSQSVPYPEFCRHKDKCAGLSSCPRDPGCCE